MTAPPSSRLRSALVEFRDRHDLPAIGGAIVDRDGHVEAEVVGVRVAAGTDPVRLDDPWHLGSCGKSITAVLYARLVEAGDARWGAPLSDLFPDLAGSMDPSWIGVTVDEVFVHRAGLPGNLDRNQMVAAQSDARPLPDQRSEVAARAFSSPPRRRGHFLYSNLGYIVIGAAIERLTGRSYETALTQRVMEPLGITSCGFGPPSGIWGHRGSMLMLGPLGVIDLPRTRSANPADPALPESDNPAVMTPAGRMHMNLADWATFQRLFITNGGGFLEPATIERLLAPAKGPGQSQALGWAPVGRAFEGASFGQQGSNTFWVATAIIDRKLERTAMVVTNRGSARMLGKTPHLAVGLLDGS